MSEPSTRMAAPDTPAREFPSAYDLVKDVSGLVSPPDVCMRIFDLMRSSSASAKDFGEVIARDPNLCARLLRMVNSSFYSFSSRIETVSRAIAIIGVQELYSLVIAVSAVRSFSCIKSSLVNMNTFWAHSVYCGLAARQIACQRNVLHPERLFVAGLLHDIGALVIFNRLPELSAELLEDVAGDEDELCRAETAALGYSHANIGGLLFNLWNLPATLHGAVRGHHDPVHTKVGQLEAAIVRVADQIANRQLHSRLLGGGGEESSAAEIESQLAGLSESVVDIERLLAQVEEQLSETLSLVAAG